MMNQLVNHVENSNSCCSKDGICGYGPTFCGAGNCTSNCNATAMCGIYSEGGNKKCGMNTLVYSDSYQTIYNTN
jgi:chitinase